MVGVCEKTSSFWGFEELRGGNKFFFFLFLKDCGVDNNSFFVWKVGGCV